MGAMRALFASISTAPEPIGPRAGADSGDPQVSLVEFHSDGVTDVGIWECTPGGWHIEDRPDTEVVHILAGRVRMTDDTDGSTREIGPGEVMVLPKGWSGRWDILETTRKLYVVVTH
jgi:uncharacterized protein